MNKQIGNQDIKRTMNKRGGATGLPIITLIQISFAIVILLALLYIAFLVISAATSNDAKDETSAKAVLNNLAGLINAQEGDTWTVQTIIKFPSDDWVLVGFDKDEGDILSFKPGKCEKACICLYDISDSEKPKISTCEGITSKNIIGESNILRNSDHFFFSQKVAKNICQLEVTKNVNLTNQELDIAVGEGCTRRG